MIHLKNPINIMTGGLFHGDSSWSSLYRKSDDCYKLYYITKGEIWIKTEFEEFKLQSGHIYLINGYKIKSYGSDNHFEVHWIHFMPQNLDTNHALYTVQTVVEIPDILLQQALRNGIYDNHGLNYDVNDIQLMQHQMRIHHHIQGVIIEVLRGYDWTKHLSCPEHKRIEPALLFIEENYNQCIKLSDLSYECSLSPNHFHKIFTNTLHITPANYITQIRMNKALTLMSQQLSIKEISYQLGYCNDAHFSRIFKRYYGFTPGLMRSNELINSEFARRTINNIQGD